MMLNFKNFKILLLLMLFAFAGKNAWAVDYSWFHFTANVKAQVKTAEGLVYDVPEAGNVYAKWSSNSAEEANQTKSHTHPSNATNVSNFEQDVTLHAIPTTGFKFLYWTKEDGSIISASEAEQNDGKATIRCNATTRCYYGASDSGQTTSEEYQDHMDSHDDLTEKYGTYSNIFNFYAVFEPILASIAVKSNNTSIGRAICSKYDNKEGDEVTIKAYCIDYDTKFLGWEVNGEIISRENPYTFTITNNPSSSDETIIYTAVFENGYNFHRIRNYVTKNYLNAISDEGNAATLVSGGAITSLELNTNDLNEVMYEAGSIVDIYYARIPNDTRYYYDYFVQGAKASRYYDFDPDDPTSSTGGVFLRMPFDAKTYTNTWAFATANEGGFRFTDENGTPKITMGERPESQWYIECVDKDLDTKENYFSLDPAKLVEVDGKYYTTLRTSWNILFNPEQMTPYVVTEVDETAGTFEMEPITGNIIPAGTPVIIETSSTDIEENRMVPTLTNAASGAPSGNNLVSSTKYFPNQSVSTNDNYKKLMVNANGQLAFGGNALSTVNGNEAYLSVANEVVKIETLPLSEIELVGVKDRKYKVEDQLVVIYADVDKGMLWCKDQGNKSIAKTEKQDGQIDYMMEITMEQEEDWDQSNWVVLQFEQPTENSELENLLKTAIGKYIKPATIKGTYSDVDNYTITMADQTLQLIDGGEPYVKNLYCTANFLPKNLNINGGEGAEGVYHGEAAHYFFMNPKIQEVCEITYAEWDGDNLFIVPLPSADNPTQNDSQIDGAFTVAWTYNCTNQAPALLIGTPYRFFAVVQRTSSSNYLKGVEREPSSDFIVYPLNLDPENNNNVITAIENVANGKAVTRVVYYNLMGVESDKAHPGINIVVTEYSDGSRLVEKVMK